MLYNQCQKTCALYSCLWKREAVAGAVIAGTLLSSGLRSHVHLAVTQAVDAVVALDATGI
jgi:hypothetical protein